MLSDVNSKNFTSAKKSADDLEHQWDTSEAKLRKIDGTTWTKIDGTTWSKIDGTIDVVLAAVRSLSQCLVKSHRWKVIASNQWGYRAYKYSQKKNYRK